MIQTFGPLSNVWDVLEEAVPLVDVITGSLW